MNFKNNKTLNAKFEYVYEKYKRLLLAKAYDILRDSNLAEDAVSEAFMRAFKHFDKIGAPDSGQTAAYLVTIARNVAINMYNREKRAKIVDIANHEAIDNINIEKMVVERDELNNAWQLIDSLQEDYRAVFLLKYAHDLQHKVIAQLLDISENNVTVRLHRAKVKLSQLIYEQEAKSGK